MDESWFEVDEVTEVVDQAGETIGRLLPGQRHQALEIRPFYTVVDGPEGGRGSIPRAAATMVAASPSASAGAAEMTPVAPVGSDGGSAWLLPAAVGLVAVSSIAIEIAVMLADSHDSSTARLVTGAAPSSSVTVTAPAVVTTTLPSVSTTVAVAPPVDEPITILETRVPGPHTAADTSLSFQPVENSAELSVEVCPSGSAALYLYGVDRDGVPIQGSGYGVIDAAGQGRMSVWYEDDTGRLAGFDQPGDPYTVAVTADTLTLRGSRVDLDLVDTWTRAPAHAAENCVLIDQLVTDLAV